MSRHSVRAAAVALAVAAAPALLAAAPAYALSPVSCHYEIRAWSGGFQADLSITNNGADIDGWTARWSFNEPTSAVQGWLALLTVQDNRDAIATNLVFNAIIRNGQTVTFGWSATAAASPSVPDDITVNGVPC